MKSCAALCAITISALLIRPVFDSVTAAHYRSAQSASQRKAGEVVIEQASLTTPETGTVNFELGTLFAPENRADPKSRLIGVGW